MLNEVEYRELKQTLGHRKVPARTPEPGAMELAADILAMALLLLYAALVMGGKVMQLSLAQALRAIRWAIEALRHSESCTQLLHRLRQAVVDEYERRSSKRALDWPHKKTERPPRLRRLSQTENALIERIFVNHTAQVA